MTYCGAILDVDGTVVRGDEALPGAQEALDALSVAGVRRIFLSNNPAKEPAAYEARFERAGLSVSREEVLTSGVVTMRYLAEEHADDALFVVGDPALVDQFEAAGLTVVDAGADADAVVASLDRTFDYDDVCEAMWTLRGTDVAFYGTDPDMVIPAAERDVPGSGAVINAIAGPTGRTPDRILGKPAETAQEMALDALDCAPEDCLVVGDRLDTDIELGARAGMTTVLVRTGVTGDAELDASDVSPDHVLDDIGGLPAVLDGDAE